MADSNIACSCPHCQQPTLHHENLLKLDIDRLQTRKELLEWTRKFSWNHTIDLGGGVKTDGHKKAESDWPYYDAIGDIDFRGKKVLDIGCNDGLWSFEAERRGAAEVYATDLVSQVNPRRDPCFRLAHKILGSKVRYFPDLSVYDLDRLDVRDFDVVLYFGVYYHLKNPLLSFTRIRQVMKEGGMLVAEGHVTADPGAVARFYYRKHGAGDRSNWWFPSIPCLREWVECSFFDIVQEFAFPQFYGRGPEPEVDSGRHIIKARAVRRADPHLGFPEDDLAEFDLNQYEHVGVPAAIEG
jgi:tRNA (mo5U34)-methyltransferase